MGRTLKRNSVVADGGEDTNSAVQPHEQDDGSNKGKFPEKIESEIAEVRERMRSSRKVGSFSSFGAGTGEGASAGAKSWVPDIVRNGAGSFWPLGERAAMKESPDPTSPGTAGLDTSFKFPGPTNGGGVQKGNAPSSVFGTNSSADSPPAPQAAGHSNGATIVSSTPDENRRKLRSLVQKVKLALAQEGGAPGTMELDDGFAEFTRVSEPCGELCTALVLFEVQRRTELHEKMGKAEDRPMGQEGLVKALEKAPSLMEVRDWRETVAALAGKLAERARQTDNGVPPGGEQSLLGTGYGICWQQYSLVKEDLSYLTVLLEFPTSVDIPEHTPRRSHSVKRGIAANQGENVRSQSDSVVRETMPPNGGGNTPSQEPSAPRRSDTTQEIDITGRGDSILEFYVALGGMPDDTWPHGTPAPYKASFRVSSHILSETSPVFTQLFTGRGRESNTRGAFPRPRLGVARDGTRVNIYRMSPLLPGEIRPLQILLYAAHMHNDKVPREIGFEDFVAIAKLCLRFQCTAPLELVVEMCWLQEWVHKGGEAMPDGFLLISYAFGSRGLFMRMTKSAILNIVDETDLEARPWPPEVKEKIWAVRQAKMEQIYACCVATVQEYLRPPKQFIDSSNVSYGRPKSFFEVDHDEPEAPVLSTPPAQTASQSLFPYLSSASTPPAADASFPTSTPRCPKGRHDCDAANLGYFMMVLTELQLLPIILNPGALAQAAGSPVGTAAGALPPRSLSQLVKVLQRIPSPPNAIHRGGVCDPMQAFRNAVIDIFNSLSGITLYDVTGKHGYALSRRHSTTPQRRGRLQSAVSIPGGPNIPDITFGDITGVGIPEGVALGILRALDTPRDVRVVAMTSRRFYETYKRHEASLAGRSGEKPQGKQAPRACPSPSLEVLTEEEARRIIWPDPPTPPPGAENGEGSAPASEPSEPSEPPPLYIGGAEPEGAREKFRAEDALFTEGKVLSVVETKQLTVEHDAYLGMHKDKVEV